MTTVAHGPQVNYSIGEDGNGPTGGGAGPSGSGEGGEGPAGQRQSQHICVVCGDESDGLHFGQFTCRACAAFFRRTVSLKLQYTCKREGNCEVDKTQRNMCRSCRYRKCLQRGMLTSAVQHARDGIGKRTKSAQKISTSSSSDTPDIKMPKGLLGSPTSSAIVSSSTSSSTFPPTAQYSLIGIHQQQPSMPSGSGQHFVPYGGQSPSLLEQTLLQLNASSQAAVAFGQLPQHYSPSTTTGESSSSMTAVSPYLVGNFTNLLAQPGQSSQSTSSGFSPSCQQQAQPQQQPSTSSAFHQPELKYLSRMLEGYHHFLSLRKASYTLVEGFPLDKRDDEDCPQSNFGTSKKICKIEASLIMDTVDKFFNPFSQLAMEDKHKMFDPFYCLFSNAERAFRTYKMFGAGDDRLLMPDGGYIRLSELQKFYENNTLVRGDPIQVAKIFENAMHYLVKTVVVHMRNIELGEMEMMALFGMFLWSDSEEISPESLQLAMRVRNEIIIDLHLYYRSQGLSEAEITLKTANLFLLIPKLERSIMLFKEDFEVAELFNMVRANNNSNDGEHEHQPQMMESERCS